MPAAAAAEQDQQKECGQYSHIILFHRVTSIVKNQKLHTDFHLSVSYVVQKIGIIRIRPVFLVDHDFELVYQPALLLHQRNGVAIGMHAGLLRVFDPDGCRVGDLFIVEAQCTDMLIDPVQDLPFMVLQLLQLYG